ncbi:MAG: hypothetical protein KAJ19_17545 [Gammaproteobacteria bacterium]|nr:hypothetical protein [Gammaproteobacteria bacterium]
MKLTVTIDTSNDTFQQEFNELANVFNDLVMRSMRGYYDTPGEHPIIDTFGNTCGTIVVEESVE